jgi:acyl carrier protein
VNSILENVLKLWSDILDVEVNEDSDFFESGGNSLRALYLTRKVEEDFGLTIKVTEIYRHPCAREFARLLCSSANEPMVQQIEQFPTVQTKSIPFFWSYSNHDSDLSAAFERFGRSFMKSHGDVRTVALYNQRQNIESATPATIYAEHDVPSEISDEALLRSVAATIQECDVLHSVFETEGENLIVRMLLATRSLWYPPVFVDGRSLSVAQVFHIMENSLTPSCLEQLPYRWAVWSSGRKKKVLFLMMHAIADFSSVSLLRDKIERNAAYGVDESKGISHNYLEYINEIRQFSSDQALARYTTSHLYSSFVHAMLEVKRRSPHLLTPTVFSRPITLTLDTGRDDPIESFSQVLHAAVTLGNIVFGDPPVAAYPLCIYCNARSFALAKYYNVVGDFHFKIPVVVPRNANQERAFTLFRESETFHFSNKFHPSVLASHLPSSYTGIERLDLINQAPITVNFLGSVTLQEDTMLSKEVGPLLGHGYPILAYVVGHKLRLHLPNGLLDSHIILCRRLLENSDVI